MTSRVHEEAKKMAVRRYCFATIGLHIEYMDIPNAETALPHTIDAFENDKAG